MLQDLNSSAMGLLGPTTKITPRSAINANFAEINPVIPWQVHRRTGVAGHT